MTPLPRPRRKLWRTWLKWPRPVRGFAPRIEPHEFLAERPSLEEAAHWSELSLLEDVIIALHRDGTSTWLTHLVLMPYGDENLAEWDDITRSYDERYVRLKLRRAVVYLPDGSQRKAARHVIPITQHDRVLKVGYSPLRRGAVVELELQDDHFRPDESGPAIWGHFAQQNYYPCRRRRLTLAIAEPFVDAAQCLVYSGGFEPERFHHAGYEVLQWDLRNVPGIEADNSTPPLREFAPWVDFSTLPDWEPIARYYRPQLVPPRPSPVAVQRLAQQLASNATTARERALAVYQYATRDVRYGRHPSELAAPKSRDIVKMLQDLRGDCKDKSTLMVALLRELGIEAHVVVLLTAAHGRMPLLPARRFDHAIVRATVDGQALWFDPAAGPFAFGDIPLNDQGVQGLLLGEKHNELLTIPLDAPARQRAERVARGVLSASGDLTLRMEIRVVGERAAQYRYLLQDRNPEHRYRTMKAWVSESRIGAEVTDVDIINLDDLGQPVQVAYTIRLPRWARSIRDLLLLRLPWSDRITVTGAITVADRAHPFQLLGPFEFAERFTIELPAEYEGYGLPIEEHGECVGVSHQLAIRQVGRELQIDRTLIMPGGMVLPQEFAEFKAFWENCARYDDVDVVLMRGNPRDRSGG